METFWGRVSLLRWFRCPIAPPFLPPPIKIHKPAEAQERGYGQWTSVLLNQAGSSPSKHATFVILRRLQQLPHAAYKSGLSISSVEWVLSSITGENGLLLLNWWVNLVPDVTDAHEPDSRQDWNSSELCCLQTASLNRFFHNPITLQTRSLEMSTTAGGCCF
jgi:hypothetical protein